MFGVPEFEFFNQSGNSVWSGVAGTANHLINSSIAGTAFGATYAGVTGCDIGKGAATGALGWTAGDAANMFIGHAVELIGSGFSKPKVSDGAWIYEGNISGGITFGNVILGQQRFSNF